MFSYFLRQGNQYEMNWVVVVVLNVKNYLFFFSSARKQYVLLNSHLWCLFLGLSQHEVLLDLSVLCPK